MKRELRNIAIGVLVCFGLATAFAQTTTYNLAVPTGCGAFAANYHCIIQAITPLGPNAVFYGPYYNNQPNIVEFFPADNELGSLGTARIDTVTSAGPFNVFKQGTPNQFGYYFTGQYVQTATFHGTDAATTLTYTGSITVGYTLSTRCCSSGRGPHEASTWTVTAGSVTINNQ